MLPGIVPTDNQVDFFQPDFRRPSTRWWDRQSAFLHSTNRHAIAHGGRSMPEIGEDVVGPVRRELAKKGWAVLRPGRFTVGGAPDEHAVVEIASWFGVPSRVDAARAGWRAAPVTSRPDATFSQRVGAAGLHTDAQYRRRPED